MQEQEKPKLSLVEMIAETRRRIAHKESLTLHLAALGKSLRFTHPRGGFAVVGPDMSKEFDDRAFRLTRISQDREPFGHSCFSSLNVAIRNALDEGYLPQDSPPPEPKNHTDDITP